MRMDVRGCTYISRSTSFVWSAGSRQALELRKNARHQDRLGADRLESRLAVKTLQVLVDNQLTRSHQCALARMECWLQLWAAQHKRDMELQERAQCGSTFRLKHRVRLSELWVLCRQEAAVAAGPEDDEEVFGLKCSQTLILVWPSSLCVVTFGSPEVKQLWLDTILSSWHSSGSRFASGLQRGSKRREVSGQLLAGRPGAPEALLCACLSRRPEVSLTAKTVEALVLAEADAKRGPPLASQPAHLLAAVLKDFLRNIPSKLLVAELYDKWLLALEKPGQQEKIEALREVAGKLPRANLLLLQRLLSVLHHISDNAESNRMDASNLAICVGPNMLSPNTDNLLPLAVHKESIDKVTLLVAFLIDNCAAVFGEDVALPLRPSADESPEHTDSSTERPCAAPQNTCACDSPEAGAAGSPPPSDMEQPKGGSASVSSSYPACASAPSLVIGKKDSSRMERSFSEPDLSFQASSLAGSRREPEAAKGEELFPRQLTKLRLEKRALEKRPCQLASTLSKSHSLPKIFSSRSLEPLLSSDGSLFPSSSLVSLLRPQKSYSKKTQAFPIKPAESTAGHLAERSDSAPGHCLLPAAAKRSKNTPHFGDLEDVRFPRASSSRKDNPFCCTAVQARRLDKNNPVKRFQGSAPIGKQNGKTCARIYMRGGPKHSSAFGCRRLARLRRNVGVLEAWKT
ncbi:LOW QUALITY PROTEIN: uncharacterized protein [Struthio camelus]|uniref:LOW QUALITY PROTEIN: uncharacterized protein n=1 Tax=Struthio camelus TaxID=8801 RepID=UPI00360428DE